MNKEEILEKFTNAGHRKGRKAYGALNHILSYGSITIRDLNGFPFFSNGSNKIIQIIKEFFEISQLGYILSYDWDYNPNTKAKFKRFYIKEV